MNPLRAFDRMKGVASQRVVDVWFAFCMAGLFVAAASYYVGVGIVPFQGHLLSGQAVAGYPQEKEVGYIAALNWSLGGALLVPALVVFSLIMHAAMEPTLRALAGQGMARASADLKIVTPDELVARWRLDRDRGLFIPTLAGTVAFAVIMIGWVAEVALPSLRGISSPDMLRIGSSAEEPGAPPVADLLSEVRHRRHRRPNP